ncbi:MAG TPA: MlaA family lipoprotein, partial [Rhizomicrobium sp.]|nr:MlaA family lipoprotein [Rhizomicrobium sp.]
MKTIQLAGIFVLSLLSAGCSTTTPEPEPDAVQVSDPLENMNRFFFGLNQRLDRDAARPAANAYKE